MQGVNTTSGTNISGADFSPEVVGLTKGVDERISSSQFEQQLSRDGNNLCGPNSTPASPTSSSPIFIPPGPVPSAQSPSLTQQAPSAQPPSLSSPVYPSSSSPFFQPTISSPSIPPLAHYSSSSKSVPHHSPFQAPLSNPTMITSSPLSLHPHQPPFPSPLGLQDHSSSPHSNLSSSTPPSSNPNLLALVPFHPSSLSPPAPFSSTKCTPKSNPHTHRPVKIVESIYENLGMNPDAIAAEIASSLLQKQSTPPVKRKRGRPPKSKSKMNAELVADSVTPSLTISDGNILVCNKAYDKRDFEWEVAQLWEIGKKIGVVGKGNDSVILKKLQELVERDRRPEA